jgi:hypothetical protein
LSSATASVEWLDELVDELERDESADGPALFERMASTGVVARGPDALRAVSSRARVLEGEVAATESSNWRRRATLYRVIGELYAVAHQDRALTLERAGDAAVAAGDTLRIHGDLLATVRRYERAVLYLERAIDLAAPENAELVSRLRGKVATLRSNIDTVARRAVRGEAASSKETERP